MHLVRVNCLFLSIILLYYYIITSSILSMLLELSGYRKNTVESHARHVLRNAIEYLLDITKDYMELAINIEEDHCYNYDWYCNFFTATNMLSSWNPALGLKDSTIALQNFAIVWQTSANYYSYLI